MAKKKQKKGNEINSLIYVFSLILIFEIILIIKIIKRFFYSKPFLNKPNNNNNSNEITYKNCKCSNCKKRYEKYLLNIKKNNINLYFYLYIILFIFFLLLLISFYQKIQILNEKKNFNPFKILQIPRRANITTIKKAYKKLSKKYHPDKPTGDKNKFMKINKAYRALTDKESIENYKKYGNPDGPGFITIEIALPEFLFKGKTANFILIIFTFLMIGVLPVWFMMWFHKKDKYNESGMMNVDQSIFYEFLDKNSKIEEIIFVIGLANEFEDVKIEKNEINKIENNFKKYEKYFPKNFDINLLPDGNKKAIVFLYEYFLHEYKNNLFDDFDENFINFMLKITNLILDNMIYMCINISMSYDFYKTFDFFPENMFKNYDLNIIKNLIILKQNLFQTGNLNLVHEKKNFLLQLPNISKENFYLFKNIKNFHDLKNSINNFKEKDFNINNNNIFEDIKIAIENIPEYKIESNISLISYEIGDLIVLKHKIKRLNLLENEKIGFNHSNIFPENFNEKIILIIINEENKIIFWKIINFSENNNNINYIEIENNFLAEKKGKNIFKIMFYSLNFIDIFYENLLEINIENENDFKLNFKKNRMRNLMSSEEINEYYNNNKSPYYYLINNNKKLKED